MVVLVDMAASIISENLEDVKLGIKQAASILALKSRNIKMGVLSHTYDSTHIVNLTVVGNFSIFNQYVDNIPSIKQSGIKEAIHVGKSMFTLKESTRNIMVLLTDGLTNHDRTPKITKNMTTGMDLVVVGVGPNINQTDLKLIAGENKTFVDPTFDYLASENFGNRIVEGNSRFL